MRRRPLLTVRLRGWPLIAATLIAGCSAVGPDYTGAPASVVESIDEYASAPLASTETLPQTEDGARWWQQLSDPLLQELVERGLEMNFDLSIAAQNVRAASAALRESQTRLRPRVDFDASLEERRNSAAAANASFTEPFPALFGGTFGLGFNWELDVFGRLRRAIEASIADTAAAEALLLDTRRLVAAAIVSAYIDIRGAQHRLAVAERNVDVQRDTLDLVEARLEGGTASELDTARAGQQLAASRATIPSLRATLFTSMNRLSALLAEPAGSLRDRLGEPRALPILPSNLALGAPADLLRRRPDIRFAERSLAAATARIGVQSADLFPTVSLGAGVGAGAARLSDLGTARAPFWFAGPAITWNIFDRRAIYARIEQADASAGALLYNYQQVVTSALEEVDSALVTYFEEIERRNALVISFRRSREATELANLRYQGGLEDFLAVLDAQRQLLVSEDLLAQSQISLAQSFVAVHRALGGD